MQTNSSVRASCSFISFSCFLSVSWFVSSVSLDMIHSHHDWSNTARPKYNNYYLQTSEALRPYAKHDWKRRNSINNKAKKMNIHVTQNHRYASHSTRNHLSFAIDYATLDARLCQLWQRHIWNGKYETYIKQYCFNRKKQLKMFT